MSSTNKTENLGLNQWIASDKPKRADFNYDNEIIDTALTQHKADLQTHISQAEREKWNSPVYCGVYFGDGERTRLIETGCPFEPLFVLVFGASRPVSVSDFSESKKYNYFGFASQVSSTTGLSLSDYGATLEVLQDITASYENEYACLNKAGVKYTYVMFR